MSTWRLEPLLAISRDVNPSPKRRRENRWRHSAGFKIGVSTDTSQFAKGLKSAANTIDSFKSTVLGIGASLGVAFGARAIVDWVHGAADAVTETRTLAERLGLTSDAMGKLQYAARLSHVDGEAFAHSLEKMNEKLGEVAITGEGPAADALRRFGLSARTLAAGGTEKAFFTLLDVMSQIQNPMERASVAMDLFGKSGQGIINMAAKGSQALQALGEEGMATGAVLSAIDAEKVSEADVAMTRIGSSITGVANQIAVELAPFVTAIADQFVAWSRSGTHAGDMMAQAIDWVTRAVGVAADAVQVWKSAFFSLQSIVLKVLQKISEGLAAVTKDMGAIAHNGWVEKLAPEVTILWDLFGKKGESTLQSTSSFFSSWADDLGKESAKAGQSAADAWSKPWEHTRVREFVDNLKMQAEERAVFNAQQSQSFARPGAFEHPKVTELGHAGAAEMGSKEAYSAIVKSRSMQLSTMQNRIEQNTRTTAEASNRAAIGISRMVNLLENKGGKDLGLQMTAGH